MDSLGTVDIATGIQECVCVDGRCWEGEARGEVAVTFRARRRTTRSCGRLQRSPARSSRRDDDRWSGHLETTDDHRNAPVNNTLLSSSRTGRTLGPAVLPCRARILLRCPTSSSRSSSHSQSPSSSQDLPSSDFPSSSSSDSEEYRARSVVWDFSAGGTDRAQAANRQGTRESSSQANGPHREGEEEGISTKQVSTSVCSEGALTWRLSN